VVAVSSIMLLGPLMEVASATAEVAAGTRLSVGARSVNSGT